MTTARRGSSPAACHSSTILAAPPRKSSGRSALNGSVACTPAAESATSSGSTRPASASATCRATGSPRPAIRTCSMIGSSSRRSPLHSARPVDPIVSTRRQTLGTAAPATQPTIVLTRSLPTNRRSGPVRTVSAAGASTTRMIRRSSSGPAVEAMSARRSSSWVPKTNAPPGPPRAWGSQDTHSQPAWSSETTTICTSAGPIVVAIWTTSDRSSAATACEGPATANASAGAMTTGIAASAKRDSCSTAAS